jgi:hypothetical protein
MAVSIDDLMEMSKDQLNDLFGSSPPGDIPNGDADGTTIIAPGTLFTPVIATLINIFGWQGKTFDAASGTLVNRITFFGLQAIIAEVYLRKSWFDGNESLVLDYSKTSLIAEWVRDEIRLIAPQLYPGITYWKDEKTIFFALQFGDSSE